MLFVRHLYAIGKKAAHMFKMLPFYAITTNRFVSIANHLLVLSGPLVYPLLSGQLEDQFHEQFSFLNNYLMTCSHNIVRTAYKKVVHTL